MTFFMIALTNSLHKLVNATIKYTGEPTRSRGEFAFNFGVDNWDQTYGRRGESLETFLVPKNNILNFCGRRLTQQRD